jgi:hypothetical protein
MTNRYSQPGFTRSDIQPHYDDAAELFRAGKVRYVTDETGTRIEYVKEVWRGQTGSGNSR